MIKYKINSNNGYIYVNFIKCDTLLVSFVISYVTVVCFGGISSLGIDGFGDYILFDVDINRTRLQISSQYKDI